MIERVAFCILVLIFVGAASAVTESELFGFDEDQMFMDNDSLFSDETFASLFGPWFDFNTSLGVFDFGEPTGFFSEFYTFTGTPIVGPISAPVRFTGHEPDWIYLVGEEPVSYTEYKRMSFATGVNQLWVSSALKWTRYLLCPNGSFVQLIADSPTGGVAEVYEIYPDNTIVHKQVQLFVGYNNLRFQASHVGRNMIFFVADNQPSNVVIIDVEASRTLLGSNAPAGSGSMAAGTSQNGQSALGGSATGGSTGVGSTDTGSNGIGSTGVGSMVSEETYFQQVDSGPEMPPIGSQSSTGTSATGDTTVTLRSTQMRGYDVFVDDVYVGSDGKGGDALDGLYTIKVVGNMDHFVKVWDPVSQFFYGKPKYYPRGVTAQLNVEPAEAAYF